MPVKVTRNNISEHLLEYQLSLIGKTVKDAVEYKEWLREWSLTRKQSEEFKKYAIPLIKKTFKCNKGKAVSTFNWWDLQFGLKIQE